MLTNDGMARIVRWGMFLALTGGFLVLSTGANCGDHDARAQFRNTATDAVGSGIKTIFDGLIDGTVAAIKNAGDGSSDSSSGT